MLTVGIVIALVLDRSFPSLRDHHRQHSLSNYFRWIADHWIPPRLPRGLIPLVLLLPMLLFVALINNFFQSGIFSLGYYSLIALACLRPSVLNEDVDKRIKELQNDESSTNQYAQRLFGLANKYLYTVIFWLVVLGPLAAVAYRMLDSLCSEKSLSANQIWTSDVVRIVSWLEWLPALISSFLFMVCGNFEVGLKAAQSMPYFASDLQTLNESRLRRVGQASLKTEHENESDIELMRRSRGLLLRSLMLWLVFAAGLEYWL